MADLKHQVEPWKTVVAMGGVLIAAGASMLIAATTRAPSGGNLETYGLCLLIGGITLALLGIAYAFRQQGEWRRPPKLSRGMSCRRSPMYHEPARFPSYPHFQELVIELNKRIYPPAFRVTCDAPIMKIEAGLLAVTSTRPDGPGVSYDDAIDAVSFRFPPREPIEPRALLFITVFSDERIRVSEIKRLRTRHPELPQSARRITPPSPPS